MDDNLVMRSDILKYQESLKDDPEDSDAKDWSEVLQDNDFFKS